MAIYNLISHAGSGKALNIYGTAQVSQNRNVCLWTQSSTSKEQQWSISTLSGNTRILSNLNTAYGLNIWLGSTNKNNCDIHTVSDNANDSLVTISTVSTGIVRIKLTNHNLYLTAQGSSDNSNVNWATATGGTNQQWKAVTVGGVTPPPTGGKTLSMPVNVNQKYKYNSDWIKKYGCAVCCGVDVTSFYGSRDYTIADLKGYYQENDSGYSFTSPTATMKEVSGLTQIEFLSKIKSEIDSGRPVIVYGPTHWVVAYGYTGGGNATGLIKVLDPAGDLEKYDGELRTLQAAMTHSSVSSITRLKTTAKIN